MSSITIVYSGPPEQRHTLKTTPMGRLRDTLKEACPKFRPALDPADCTLTLNSKPVDLDAPFRLLNLPANARLEVVKVAAAASGASSTKPSSSAAPPAANAPAPGPSSTPDQGQQQDAQQQQGLLNHQQTEQQQHKEQQQQARQGEPADATASASGQQQQQQQQGSADVGGPLQALGIAVPLHVFSQSAVEAAAAAEAASAGQPGPSAAADDNDDAFYEFTPQDYATLQRAADDKKKHDALFRGRSLREAEARERAEAFGDVPVRFHFPDRSIIQASFPATATIASLQSLVGACLAPQLLQSSAPARPGTASRGASAKSTPNAQGYYLYTAPPKTVLKDGEAALWQVGLLPAAHVYVALDASNPAAKDFSGPYLRPEVASLMQDTVPQLHTPQQHEPAAAAGSSGGDVAAARKAHAASEAGKAGGGQGGKLPKWFKGK